MSTSADSIVVAVDFRGLEGPGDWGAGASLHLATGFAPRLGEGFRAQQPPAEPAPMAADCPTPFEVAMVELDGLAARLGAESSERTSDTVRYRFPCAAWRSALRLALDAVARNEAGWTADMRRSAQLGVGIARGSAEGAGGPAWTRARRLAVLAPGGGILTCERVAELVGGEADLAPVAEGAWQVMWARRGGPLEKRRGLRVPCEQPALLRTTAGRAVAAHTRDVSRGGACLVLEDDVPMAAGASVAVDLPAMDARFAKVAGRVVEASRDAEGRRVARIAFTELDAATRAALTARLFGAQGQRGQVDSPPGPRLASSHAEPPGPRLASSHVEPLGPRLASSHAEPSSPPSVLEQPPTSAAVAEAFEALASARTVEEVGKTVVLCADRVVGLQLPWFQVDREEGATEDDRIQVLAVARGGAFGAGVSAGEPPPRTWLIRLPGRFTATLQGRGGRPEAEPWLRSLLVCAGAAMARLLDRPRALPEKDRARAAERLLKAQRAAAAGAAWSLTAHELNNALTPLLAGCHFLMEREDVPVDARNELARLMLQSEQVAEEVARLQAWQRMRVERQVLDVHRVIFDVATLWRARLDAAGIGLELDLEAALPRVEADPLQLAIVFHQLLENAHAAVQRAGRPGCIRIRSFEEDGVPCVEVSDNGPGIPESLRDIVFERYASDSAVEGAGLGLSLSRYLVERLGGSIGVASTGPGGTAVRLALATGSRTKNVVPEPTTLSTRTAPL